MFPENSEVSSSAINLIGNLLQDRATRFRYESAKSHEFFKGIDFVNLSSSRVRVACQLRATLKIFFVCISAVPPFVPNISRPDDSKYFASFSPAPPTTHDSSFLRDGSGFKGENLRFIGFSYSREGKRTFEATAAGSPAVVELLKKKETECRTANEKLFESELECEKLRNDLLKESFRHNQADLERTELREKCANLLEAQQKTTELHNKSAGQLNIYNTTADAVKAVFDKQKAVMEAERDAFQKQIADAELAVTHYQQRLETAARRADMYEVDLEKQNSRNKELTSTVERLKEQLKLVRSQRKRHSQPSVTLSC